jgi:hypothetical protein
MGDGGAAYAAEERPLAGTAEDAGGSGSGDDDPGLGGTHGGTAAQGKGGRGVDGVCKSQIGMHAMDLATGTGSHGTLSGNPACCGGGKSVVDEGAGCDCEGLQETDGAAAQHPGSGWGVAVWGLGAAAAGAASIADQVGFGASPGNEDGGGDILEEEEEFQFD